MKNYLKILLIFSVVLTACSSKVVTTPSSDATVSKFYFMSDSRWPGLGEATFEVDDRVDTGWIYPTDSLRYGTRLDSVVPRFVFAATPSSANLTLGDTTLSLTGTDTLNFYRTPIYVSIVAADTKAKKVYEIKVFVHETDPDLYVWERLTSSICPSEPMETKALLTADGFYFFTNNGFENRLYTSADAKTWAAEAAPTGLPSDCRVRSICYNDEEDLFYYADEAGVYTSSDGAIWTLQALAGYVPEAMLMVFNDEPWLIVKRVGETALRLATLSSTGKVILHNELMAGDTLPEDFPTYGFAAVEYVDAGLYRHGLVAGGFTKSGRMVGSAYNIEVASRPVEDTLPCVYRMTNYAYLQAKAEPHAYRAYVSYNDQLESYGGVNERLEISDSIRFSDDAGLTWTVADTAESRYPEGYSIRYESSALTDGEYIYVIGGQGTDGVYTDVYRAKLNSIDW